MYSLPASFENFRCAIESRDTLPTPDALRTKIAEVSDARKGGFQRESSENSNALYVNKDNPRSVESRDSENKKPLAKQSGGKPSRCYICKRSGHKKAACWFKDKDKKSNSAKCATENVYPNPAVFQAIEHNRDWCLDSGATTHFCNDIRGFSEINKTDHGVLNLANHSTTEITAKGKVEFISENFDGKTNLLLTDALHVPDLRANLMSVSKITDRGYDVTFNKEHAKICDMSGKIILIAHRVGDLFYVRECSEDACVALAPKPNKISLETLHRQCGHANIKDISDALTKNIVTGVLLKESSGKFDCDVCLKAKMVRMPFANISNRNTKILDIVHTDVCGPMRTSSLGGALYYITFIDDCSKWCEVKFLKNKSDVLEATKEFIARAEKQSGRSVRALQSDNGREYLNKEFDAYLKSRGIVRRLTVPYNPEHNGTAERKNRTLGKWRGVY